MALTDNINMLSPLGFRLTINATEFANVEYFCTSVSLPSIDLPEIKQSYRNRLGSISGETLSYSPLSIRFIIDEEMRNYLEIFNWMTRNAQHEIQEKDMTLSILSNQNTSNKQIQFLEAFPTSLAELEFDTQNTSVEYLSADIQFGYDRFKFL